MAILWGVLMSLIGGLFVFWGSTKSGHPIYRRLAARSQLLWGPRVHAFYVVVGVILMTLGLLWACGVIWQR